MFAFILWGVIKTIIYGGLVILAFNSIIFISKHCYLFKIPPTYQKRFCLVTNFKECVKATLDILKRHPHTFQVVGMDCEMTSTSVNGGHPVPALLQLANPYGYCAIFQLKVIEKSQDKIIVPFLTERPKTFKYKLPCENVIRQVLEDPNILKVGVAVIDDARYLEESYGLYCKGCLDLRYLALCVGIEPRGLDYLAKKVLGKEKVDLKKNHKTPWESKNLPNHQIRYALQDGRLGVELFLELNKRMIEQSYSWLRRLSWDEKTYWKYSIKLWRDYVGKNFVFRPLSFNKKTWISYIPTWLNQRRYFQYTSLMLESAHPRSESIRAASESASERLCFVCGFPDDGSLNVKLKAIVPVDYGVEIQDDNLYYICLCRMCLEESRTKVDYELRQELTEECGAPYPDYEDHRLDKVKKIATELLSNGNSDKEWTKILECNLLKFLPDLPNNCFQRKTMEIILSMDCWPGTDHGKFVHEYFYQYGGGVEELRWRWCARFWKVMRPQYMPRRWMEFYRSDPRWNWIMS